MSIAKKILLENLREWYLSRSINKIGASKDIGISKCHIILILKEKHKLTPKKRVQLVEYFKKEKILIDKIITDLEEKNNT